MKCTNGRKPFSSLLHSLKRFGELCVPLKKSWLRPWIKVFIFCVTICIFFVFFSFFVTNSFVFVTSIVIIIIVVLFVILVYTIFLYAVLFIVFCFRSKSSSSFEKLVVASSPSNLLGQLTLLCRPPLNLRLNVL